MNSIKKYLEYRKRKQKQKEARDRVMAYLLDPCKFIFPRKDHNQHP